MCHVSMLLFALCPPTLPLATTPGAYCKAIRVSGTSQRITKPPRRLLATCHTWVTTCSGTLLIMSALKEMSRLLGSCSDQVYYFEGQLPEADVSDDWTEICLFVQDASQDGDELTRCDPP